MFKSSVLARSFRPEQRLIHERDAEALWAKYRASLPGGFLARVGGLVDYLFPRDTELDNNIHVFQSEKQLGSLSVETDSPLPASGRDEKRGISIDQGSREAIELHLDSGGAATFRTDLAQAADYIRRHDVLLEAPVVTGLTYREIGNICIALGFNEMEITSDINRHYYYSLVSAHQTFRVLSNRPDSVFHPTLIYLPTPEFVERFAPPQAA